MKLEVLYPEIGNLFGDSSNVKYLRLCLPEADIIQTSLNDEPSFINDNIDFIYMGPMTERNQEKAIKKLATYTDELAGQIEKGTHFLFTGNSFEILGKYIKTDEGELPALGIFDMYSERRLSRRHNSLFLGEFEDMKITAFNSRFSYTYPSPGLTGFANVLRGIGLNESCPFEGICRNNFIGTYLLGPLLVLNPHFLAYLLRSLGDDSVPAFWHEALAAYEKRLAEFQDDKVKLD